MDLETLFRLFVAAVVTVAPTLLFLGLWRGLMALRDDDLVNRTMNGEFGPMPNSPVGNVIRGFGGAGSDRPGSRIGGNFVRCSSCDAPNPGYADYCGTCLEELG